VDVGLDLIELDYRIEKRFSVRIGIDAWERAAAGRIPFDLTAADVTRLVADALDREGISLSIRPDGARPTSGPPVLNYATNDLRKPIDNLWEEVRDIIAATLRVPAVRVAPGSWLRRDLGMEC
jgi:hypothetical protein